MSGRREGARILFVHTLSIETCAVWSVIKLTQPRQPAIHLAEHDSLNLKNKRGNMIYNPSNGKVSLLLLTQNCFERNMKGEDI